ncbi:XLF/Cernunnos [Niveomyces insectorum RCEF 264]|uniref:Non-homologous end-joining factor 1 n=1 Tax=Niveomyces insectorum RCEF 264 TaxID=1081102 RepID=A0A162ICR0_9HYPO|nr:XLF/Cernunnos [Niveomyces insectorum RCEF 264]
MDDRRAWRLLPAAHPDVPLLLVSAVFGDAAYAVHLTDLANVWSESLSRRDICLRAFKVNTTIDPSYDKEQMAVFLTKLRAAFDVALPDHADTRLSVAGARNGGGGGGGDAQRSDDLVLHITAVLPQGLRPLKWPMHLKKHARSSVAGELVLPLVQDHAVRLREIDALRTVVHDKDAVINKLVDKLDAMGAGLASVFPQLAGRRKVTRTDMEGRVPGLAPFDAAAFRETVNAGVSGGDAGSVDAKDLLESVFGGESGLKYDAGVVASVSHNLDGWWQELGTGPGVSLVHTQQDNETKVQKNKVDLAIGEDEDSGRQDDEAFQTTPSKRRLVTEEAQESAKEDKMESEASSRPNDGKEKHGTHSRSGAIGRKKAASPSPPPDSEEETASDKEATASRHTTPEQKEATKPAKRETLKSTGPTEQAPTVTTTSLRSKPAKHGLGSIGGRKPPAREQAKSPSPAPRSPSPKSKGSAPATPAKKGLGRIGKRTSPPTPTSKGEREDGGRDKSEAHEQTHAERKAGVRSEEATTPKEKNEKTTQGGQQAERLQQAVEKNAAPMRKKRKF